MENQQRRKPGRPKGSKTKNRKPKNRKQKTEAVQVELLPAATPENPAEPSGTSAGSPSEGDNFERVAASVPPVIGDETGGPEMLPPDGAAPAPPPIVTADAVMHWIDVPFRMLAVAAKNETLALEEYEREMLAPAVAGVLNRYLPDILKRTDHPELAMLGLALTAYAMRAGVFTWVQEAAKKKKPEPGLSADGTAMPVSRAS